MPAGEQIAGFKYTSAGTPVSMTEKQWRELNHTHERRIVVKGETWYVNRDTRRVEFEAYGNIRP